MANAQSVVRLCEKHSKLIIDMYCETCRAAMCSKCVREGHGQHDFHSIVNLFRELNSRRQDLYQTMADSLARKSETLDRVSYETRKRNENMHAMKIQKLEEKREEIRRIVDRLIDNQVMKCNEHYQTLKDKGAIYIIDSTSNLTLIKEKLESFQNTTTTGLDFIKFYEELKHETDTAVYDSFDVRQFCDQKIFKEGVTDAESLNRMIGEVNDVDLTTAETEELSSFNYNSKYAVMICPIANDRAWITYLENKQFFLMTSDGHQKGSVQKSTDRMTFVMKSSPTDTFISGDYNSKKILQINGEGKQKELMSTALHPYAIGQTLDGNLLISLMDKSSGTRTADSQRLVRMITVEGKVLHEYQYGKDGTTPILILPVRVVQNYNSNVCVVNQYEISKRNHRGNVCVFYEDGRLKFTYEGKKGYFSPFDVCVDSSCNIICTSALENCIHVIGSEGQLLKYLCPKQSEMRSISLYDKTLWIGSKFGEIKVYRYSL